MLAKNQLNRNKTDNTAKTNIKSLDFMSFIQKTISIDISSGNGAKNHRNGLITMLSEVRKS